MASKAKKSGGDFVLESRHLVGLFLLLVVIFGVVFTLGYLLGRNQYDSTLRAAITKPPVVEPSDAPTAVKSKAQPQTVEGQAPPRKSDWDFYHSAEPKTTEDHLQPLLKPTAVAKPPAASKPAGAPSKSAGP